MAEYKQTLSVKIVRKKHVVTCFPHEDVSNILSMLLKVPVGSIVDDFDIDEHGALKMQFHDEHADNTE